MIRRASQLWHYRHLVVDLVALDLKVRYKGSALGFLWSLLNPLLMTAIFTVVFGFLLKQGYPHYPVFFLAALLPWNYFATAAVRGTTSVTQNAALLNKVYFPSEVFPIAIVLSALVNFLLSLPVLFGLMLINQVPLSPGLVLLPIIVVIQTAFCLAVALFVAALNVRYRDTTLVMEVVIQAGFFFTPIVYVLESINAWILFTWAAVWIRWLNPMAALVDFYRDILYGGFRTVVGGVEWSGGPGWPSLLGVGRTGLTVAILLVLAYAFFIRRSANFAEEA